MKRVGLLLGCLILIASSALQAMAQRTGTVPQLVVEPIKVTTLSLNAPKRSGSSWTTQPLVQVENTSKKTIEYLTIEAKLPGVTDPFMLAYGHAPGKPATSNVAPLQPGAKITLSVNRDACDWIKKRLGETDARTLGRATVRINGVVFNDQTAWFDGLPHVMEPNNPRRWQVVKSNVGFADVERSPVFGFLRVGYRENTETQMCWDRLGTEWVDCCGLQQASAIMVQVWGGVFEPIPMSTECCEWIKQGGCL